MAVAKYGAMITELKGKIGGTVFQGSRTGGVAKNKPAQKTTSGSSKLTKADAGRLFLPQRQIASLATRWRLLSESDQLSWTTAAPSYPFINKYGEPYTASGYQLYMSMNMNLTVIGADVLDVPPTPSDVDPTPVFSFTWTYPTGLEMTCVDGVNANYVLQLYATSAMSPGRRPVDGDYKLIALFTPGFVFPVVLETNYISAFGSPLTNGTVWFKGKLTKADAGRNSVPYVANAVVGV